VHLTPEARAFFSLAISEQNFAFAKFSLLLGQVTSTMSTKRTKVITRCWRERQKINAVQARLL